MSALIQILTGFLGSLGFSVLFQLRGKKLFFAAFGGFLSWSLYLLFGLFFQSEPLQYFLSAVAVTIYSEILARILKTPTSTFLVSSIVPLIPGGALYNTMCRALDTDFAVFTESAAHTGSLALSLAAGIVAVSSVMKIINAVTSSLKKR